MLMVVAIGMIVAILAAAMFASVLQNQSTTRRHLDVTSAQGAAEAALDDAVYQLGLVGTNGTANWTNWQSTHNSQSTANQLDLGSNNASAKAWVTAQAGTTNLIVWAKGNYGGNSRTIRAVVAQGSPPAFDYSMFASKGIDIHQHGGWLSPQVWTTSVHSNGYIYIDYPSEFNVNSLEAVGNLTLEKGGGKIPSGTVTSNGYSWPDPLNGMCYPGGYQSPGGTTARNQDGSCPNTYPGYAVINGAVDAGSLTLGSHGIIKKVASPYTLDTGQLLQGYQNNGDPPTNGSPLVGSSNVNCTTSCNKASPTGGQLQGTVTVKANHTPAVIPFPSVDFSTKLRPYAQARTNHYFTSPSQFLTYITGGTGDTSMFYNASSSGALTPWTPGKPFPDVIMLTDPSPLNTAHVWDVNGGSLSLDFGTILKNVEASTGLTGSAAPTILVQGDLIVEAGGVTLSSGLVIVGADEGYNGIVIPYNPLTRTPAHIDTSTTGLLKSAANAGVLAAGGQISSNDYDTDSPWTSTSTYEPQKAAPVYIRGLVYSASWNATTKASTPQNQHWHNFDPKNLMKIYGAQVGADLHDCNNFSFTYDPIVKTALGFGGGSVKILTYQELGN
jgi:Tfp pilus assembly protein PilX